MPALPLELCLEVFERTHFNNANLSPEYKTLRNLSLVCRAFGYHAQKALFHNVILRRPRQALAFVQATDPVNERGRSLGAAVRSLTIKVEDGGSKADIDCHAFISIFLRCPDLVELVLRSTLPMGDDSFSDDEVEALNKFAPRSLRCIKSFQSRVGFWLIEFCPWITGLSLGDDLHEVISRDSYAKLCTDNLVELQWFGRMDYLTHLLGVEDDPSETRRHSIEILGLRDATDMMEWELGRSVLQSLGPGLRSLHLNACNPAYVACIIKHVRNLEEFILDVLPSEELLDALPPTIQHLQIRSPSNISCTTDLGMDRLLHWIPTAKNLKVLTWVAWGCSGHGLYESIEALCKQMGAQLRLYAGPFGVFPGELETLACGHVKSFPRPLAFSPARKGVYQMTNSVKQFVGGLADHATQEITDDSTQPAPPRRNAIKSRYSVPNPRVVSFNPKTPTFLDPSSGTFVPETASNAFTFSSPQTSLPVPSGSSVPSTAQSTFKFSFGTKPTS